MYSNHLTSEKNNWIKGKTYINISGMKNSYQSKMYNVFSVENGKCIWSDGDILKKNWNISKQIEGEMKSKYYFFMNTCAKKFI